MNQPGGETVQVDERDFVYVDGIKVGRRVRGTNGRPKLQVCDKDRRRASKRGTRYVEVSVEELAVAIDSSEGDNQGREAKPEAD